MLRHVAITATRASTLTPILVEALEHDDGSNMEIIQFAQSGQIAFVESCVDQQWLFPQCCCLVHHGGAGTTAEALRSGIPSAVTPFFCDQPWMADQLVQLGVGVRCSSLQTMTAASLAEDVGRVISSEGMRNRAVEVQSVISSENGVASAVDLILPAIARIREWRCHGCCAAVK